MGRVGGFYQFALGLELEMKEIKRDEKDNYIRISSIFYKNVSIDENIIKKVNPLVGQA